MKFNFSILALTILVFVSCTSNKESGQKANSDVADPAHTSQNALDWSGTYLGLLPCASCPGINTEVKLNDDLTYQLSTQYMDEEDETINRETGSFTWSKDGRNITLQNAKDSEQKTQFKVGENRLIQLDTEGNTIEGSIADNYVLEKIQADENIVEKYWKLVELEGKKVTMTKDQPREAHFILKTDENRIIGSGGCNLLNGTYKLEDGNRVSFSLIATTMMACENMETEQSLLEVLGKADNYTIHNDTLSLNKAKMAPMAKFEAVYLY